MEFILLFLLNFLGFVILFFLFKNRINQKLNARERVKELEAEINALLAQFNGAADRNITILEERILKLEDLLRRADHRIKLLQEKVKEESKNFVASEPSSQGVYVKLGNNQHLNAASMKMSKITPNIVGQPKSEELHEKVFKLYEDGVSVENIAHHFNISISEVKLILGLSGVQT